MSLRDFFVQVAQTVPFDNATNGFSSDNVQEAIEEIGASASPGFSFGRSGNVSSGSWLLRTGSVPSNKAGVTIGLVSPSLIKIQTGNEDLSTYSIAVYEHEGNEVNLTLLTTVNVVAARSASFSTSVVTTSGRQVAVLISAGSCKNVGVDLIFTGTA